LVENAVRHGVTKKEEGGTVTIAVLIAGDEAILSVEDDGNGMAEPLDVILTRTDNPNGGGVGLKNIHQRLLRQFGKGLEAESEVGRGTRIVLRLPLKAGDLEASD